MQNRVDSSDVAAILRDYDEATSLIPFIAMANALTDKVEAKDEDGELTSALLVEIERCLAAHFYDQRDHGILDEKTGDAAGVYTGQFGMRLDATRPGRDAIVLDVTGYLAKLSKGIVKARLKWLGLPGGDQTAYTDRQ